MSIADQLSRRGVFQTAALYIAIAWGGTEIIAFLTHALWGEQPAAVVSKYLSILFIAGFPVAMYLAWTRELGLQGRRVFVASAIAVCVIALLSWLVPEEQRGTVPEQSPLANGAIRSLAVLPLDDLSAEPDQGYLAAGLTDLLITELSRLRTLKVISRKSVLHYTGSDKSVPEIARELGVDAIVEGSIVRAGSRVRISAQLIEVATNRNVWADSFESELQDVLALQNETARAIARGIGTNIEPAQPSPSEQQALTAEAMDAYLRALMLFYNAPSRPEDAVRAMEEVIELAPEFAHGYALLSEAYGYFALINNITHGDAYLRARQLARKALELQPGFAYAHFVMARVHFQFEWDWGAAEKEFETGLSLDPNSSAGLAYYGAYRVLIRKDCDSGIPLLEAAVERDPLNPGMHFDLGVYNFHCRRPEAAIRALDRTVELAPSFLRARMIRGWNLSLLGRHEEATSQCDALLGEISDAADAMLISGCSWAEQRAGNTRTARALATQLVEAPAGTYVDPVILAFACAAINESGCALDNLERGLRERSSNLIFLRTTPAFDPLRELPRFKHVVEQMNFPTD